MNDEPENNEPSQTNNSSETTTRYPKRDRKKPKNLNDYELNGNEDEDDATKSLIDYCYKVSCIPKTYQEAILSPESSQWKLAMDKEIKSLQCNDTYDLILLPPDRQPIGSKWVYSTKIDSNGEEKLKACFVAKGYSQTKEID